jgi:hypothetical protein
MHSFIGAISPSRKQTSTGCEKIRCTHKKMVPSHLTMVIEAGQNAQS